ncbi:hypothetical protein Drorol1_Dr00020099 [Drosera rotundifolia]
MIVFPSSSIFPAISTPIRTLRDQSLRLTILMYKQFETLLARCEFDVVVGVWSKFNGGFVSVWDLDPFSFEFKAAGIRRAVKLKASNSRRVKVGTELNEIILQSLLKRQGTALLEEDVGGSGSPTDNEPRAQSRDKENQKRGILGISLQGSKAWPRINRWNLRRSLFLSSSAPSLWLEFGPFGLRIVGESKEVSALGQEGRIGPLVVGWAASGEVGPKERREKGREEETWAFKGVGRLKLLGQVRGKANGPIHEPWPGRE